MSYNNNTIYRVAVTREGDHWLADVPELPGAHTYARTLPALEREVREVIALAEDLPEGAEPQIRVEFDIHTGDDELDADTAAVRLQRVRLAEQERELSVRTLAVVRRLRDGRMPVRDVAKIVGISAQRVSQIAPDQNSAQAS